MQSSLFRVARVLSFFTAHFLGSFEYLLALALLLLAIPYRGSIALFMNSLLDLEGRLGLEGALIPFSMYIYMRALYAKMPQLSPVASRTILGKTLYAVALVTVSAPLTLLTVPLFSLYRQSYLVSVLAAVALAVAQVYGTTPLLVATALVAPVRPVDAIAVLVFEALSRRESLAVVKVGREVMTTAGWLYRVLALVFALLIVYLVSAHGSPSPSCPCEARVTSLLGPAIECKGECPDDVALIVRSLIASLGVEYYLVLLAVASLDSYLDSYLRYLYVLGRRFSAKPLVTLVNLVALSAPLAILLPGFEAAGSLYALLVATLTLWVLKPDIYRSNGLLAYYLVTILALFLLVPALSPLATVAGYYALLALALPMPLIPWAVEYARHKLGC
ncbi:hypothetical protein Tpen_1330 [Thermofilum pendens Hrk 5]|uniref:Uncharacterized protein n=1 Tax=Thermofilum pendens (strain DSM 2475 / Hrk 5) TaxID=368408 RepID=A1RZU7_THEPD|nr:hypothetical protein Tpen_1330 [Thermofilum pendens Hrk 5]